MAGRTNFQTCRFQCIRPGELWQCNWLEGTIPRPRHLQIVVVATDGNFLAETGTVVSLVYDIAKKRTTTLAAFSKGTYDFWAPFLLTEQPDADAPVQGHWENPEAAHGDKRNAADFERWRGLARIGIQTDRHMLAEQADIVDVFRGKGDLEPIEQSLPTL